MLPGRRYAPEDFLALAWRRKWLIVLPLIAASLAAAVVARALPNRYRSEALIQSVPQRVPETYVRSTVTSRIEDRLQSLRQQILNRTRLEALIAEFDLYPEERRTKPLEQIIEQLTLDIQIEIVKGDAFKISYTSRRADTAMQVANRLAAMIIDENVRDRESMAEGAKQFFEAQLEDARRRLVEQEKQLETYRRAHAGELPSQLESNLQKIQSTELQLQALTDSINRDRDRRLILERSLADLRSAERQAGAAPAGGARPPSAATQLEQARASLRTLLTQLTPEHPDVLREQQLVRALERKAAEGADGVAPLPPVGVAPADGGPHARRQDAEAELAMLDKHLASKQDEERRLRKVILEYQARADAAPARESDLIALTRDYDTLKNMYTTLLSKREDSKLAASLERRQIGEQFTMLDRARAPERPASPNRLQITALGSVAGLMLGIVMVVLLELLNSTFRTDAEVVAALGLPVLAMIPVLRAPRRFRRRRVRRAAGGVTG